MNTRGIANANDIVAGYRRWYGNGPDGVDTCIAHVQSYGDWDASGKGPLVIPSILSGGDYAGTTLVQKSNHRAFSEAFAAGEGVWWVDVIGGHGTFAIVIDAGAVPEDMETELTEFLGALSDYPLADEELHSEMEREAESEAWESWARKDFADKLEKFFEASLEGVDEGALSTLFHETADRIGEYWVNESGDNMWIDCTKIARAVDQDAFDALPLSHEGWIARVEAIKDAAAEDFKGAADENARLRAILETLGVSEVQINYVLCSADTQSGIRAAGIVADKVVR